MRTRLEARWAVFHTAMRQRWGYEVEGFEFDNGTGYLPDFMVHTPQGSPMWVEVKPVHIRKERKYQHFAKHIGDRCMLVSGDPLEHLENASICPRCGLMEVIDRDGFSNVRSTHEGVSFTYMCDHCDYETPCGGGHKMRHDGLLQSSYYPHEGIMEFSKAELDNLGRQIKRAAKAARQARFEHGECG